MHCLLLKRMRTWCWLYQCIVNTNSHCSSQFFFRLLLLLFPCSFFFSFFLGNVVFPTGKSERCMQSRTKYGIQFWIQFSFCIWITGNGQWRVLLISAKNESNVMLHDILIIILTCFFFFSSSLCCFNNSKGMTLNAH